MWRKLGKLPLGQNRRKMYDNMAQYFEFLIHTPSDCYFGDFAHWLGIKLDINQPTLTRY